jgi:hypothetical protein
MAEADNAIGKTREAARRGMRFLKVLTIVMGALIVAATTVLTVLIAQRIGGTRVVPIPLAMTVDEPAGTRIVGIAAAGDRLAVLLQGGGPDRMLLVDPRTGAVAGRISLRDSRP